MLELFIILLLIVASWLLTFSVREISASFFNYLADQTVAFEQQKKVVLVLHRINSVSHYTMGYLKSAGAIVLAVWITWLALALR